MSEAKVYRSHLLEERSLDEQVRPDQNRERRPARSVTVNVTESPLGWLFARGHVSSRQLEAGERLRRDWERGSFRRA